MLDTKKIRLNCDFKRLYYKGKYKTSPNVVTYALKTRRKHNRIGITTGKKIGNAVARNRARRLIYAAYITLEKEIPKGYDLVFVARENILKVKSYTVAKDIKKQMEWIVKTLPK